MGGFNRRFSSMPDPATIAAIEGVVIVDDAPDGPVQPASSGTVVLVGEYEDGGFAVDAVAPALPYYPPGGLIDVGRDQWSQKVGTFGFTVNGVRNAYPCRRRGNGEAWNGNAYVQAKGLAFRRFLAARVDVSVGSVTLSPMAFLESATAGPWALATGQTLVASINGGANATATFTGAAAQVTGAGATLSTIAAGEYVDIALDGGATVRTTFQAGDVDITTVVARINQAFGATVASNATNQVRLTSPTGGTGSKVNVVGGSTGLVTKLGLTVAVTSGSGNVVNIGSVTAAEVKTVVEAGIAGSKVRITATGKVRICSGTGGTGTVSVIGTSTAVAFGFTTGTTATATSGVDATTIPAGTAVLKSGTAGSRVVTMQTLNIPPSTTVAVTVKVRPALDDGTFAQLAASQIDTIETVVSTTSEWTVSNPAILSAALTDAQIDAAYEAAIAKTRAISGVQRQVNIIVSARQSDRCRTACLENAKLASANGCFGRRAYVSPPIGTTLTTMTSSAAPGITAGLRHERCAYSPGWRKFIAEIGTVGATGGVGFNDTGIVEVHGDIVLASLASLLSPGENPAQTTELLPSTYVGVESAIAGWTMEDYQLAKAAGICAPRYHETEGAQFQSGVTTVDRAAYPSQVPLARVILADFLTDSIAEMESPYVKQLKTPSRVDGILGRIEEFLQGEVDGERIAAKDVKQGPALRRALVIDWKAEPFDSMDSIVNRTTIGEGAITTSRQGQ